MGRGFPARGHADRAMAGRVQQLHQPRAVRVLQQEVPPRIHCRAPEQELLGNAEVQRERHVGQLVVGQQGFILHHQSSRLHQTAIQPGDERFLYIQRLSHHPHCYYTINVVRNDLRIKFKKKTESVCKKKSLDSRIGS